MAAKAVRCRPNLWHLFVLLFLSMCVISLVLYSLNNHFEKPYVDTTVRFLPSENRHDFKADFRTVPQRLTGGRRRLVVLVNSHWRNFDRRLAIRNTWALNQHRLNCSVFFMVGDSDDESIRRITEEGNFFHDIIQPTVLENEQNTVLKLLAAFRFVENEVETDFVMKTNDDVFVNLPEITEFLKPYVPVTEADTVHHVPEYLQVHFPDADRPQKLIFGGRIQQETTRSDQEQPDLSPDHWQNHIPSPDYASGIGYIVSFDVLRRFNLCPKVMGLFPLEDVYFTGLCRHHFGLPLEHDDKFVQNTRLNLPCLWKSKFITAGVKHSDMEKVWNTVNKKSTPKC